MPLSFMHICILINYFFEIVPSFLVNEIDPSVYSFTTAVKVTFWTKSCRMMIIKYIYVLFLFILVFDTYGTSFYICVTLQELGMLINRQIFLKLQVEWRKIYLPWRGAWCQHSILRWIVSAKWTKWNVFFKEDPFR